MSTFGVWEGVQSPSAGFPFFFVALEFLLRAVFLKGGQGRTGVILFVCESFCVFVLCFSCRLVSQISVDICV